MGDNREISCFVLSCLEVESSGYDNQSLENALPGSSFEIFTRFEEEAQWTAIGCQVLSISTRLGLLQIAFDVFFKMAKEFPALHGIAGPLQGGSRRHSKTV
jgi:hypothetical protein